MKSVICAGGRGRRMRSMTSGELPKSLLHAGGKPILAYQLEQMSDIGINDVLLMVNDDKTSQYFSGAVRTAYFPKLNYDIDVRHGNHPLHAFASDGVKSYLNGGDFMWSLADIVPEDGTIRKVVSSYSNRRANYGSRWFGPNCSSTNAYPGVNCRNLIDNTTGKRVSLNPPFVLLDEAKPSVYDEAAKPAPKTLRLMQRVCDEGELYGVGPFRVLNINTPDDLKALENAISQKNARYFSPVPVLS